MFRPSPTNPPTAEPLKYSGAGHLRAQPSSGIGGRPNRQLNQPNELIVDQVGGDLINLDTDLGSCGVGEGLNQLDEPFAEYFNEAD